MKNMYNGRVKSGVYTMTNESFLEYIRTMLVILSVNEENIKQKCLIDKLIRDIDEQQSLGTNYENNTL